MLEQDRRLEHLVRASDGVAVYGKDRVGVRLILGHIAYISAHYFYFQHFRCLFILSTVPCTVIVNSYYTFDVQERTVKNGAVCQ